MDDRFSLIDDRFSFLSTQMDANHKILLATFGELRADAEVISLRGTTNLRERVAIIEHELSPAKLPDLLTRSAQRTAGSVSLLENGIAGDRSMRRSSKQIVLALTLLAGSAHACTVCDSKTAHSVRRGIFNGHFLRTALFTLAPLPVLLGSALWISRSMPLGSLTNNFTHLDSTTGDEV